MAKPYALFRGESSTWTWSPEQGSILQAQSPHALVGFLGQRVARGVPRMPLPPGHPEARQRGREKQRAQQGPEFLFHGLTWIIPQRSTEESGPEGRRQDRRQRSTRRSQVRYTPAGLHLSFQLPVLCSPLLFPCSSKNTRRAQRPSVGSEALYFNSE